MLSEFEKLGAGFCGFVFSSRFPALAGWTSLSVQRWTLPPCTGFVELRSNAGDTTARLEPSLTPGKGLVVQLPRGNYPSPNLASPWVVQLGTYSTGA